MTRALPAVTLLAVAATLTLTACSPVSPTPSVSHAASAAPTRSTPPAQTPLPTTQPLQQPASDQGPCAGVLPQRPADDGAVEQLAGGQLIVPIDRGPLAHANGTAITDTDGTPVAYIVAANDNFESIGARFCIEPTYLDIINSVRRVPGGLSPQTLFVGDTVNLDAHTIFSIGDQNGVVYSNPFPDVVYPPQR